MYRRMLIPKQALVMATLVVGHLLLFSPAAYSSRPMGSPHLAGLRQLEAQTEGMTECMDALFQLRSCTTEIVLFFLNGDSYLGQDCCQAIRFITSTCWPALFASIGFTPEEADILRGYCDATASSPPPAASPPTPSSSPSPAPSPTPAADHLI